MDKVSQVDYSLCVCVCLFVPGLNVSERGGERERKSRGEREREREGKREEE